MEWNLKTPHWFILRQVLGKSRNPDWLNNVASKKKVYLKDIGTDRIDRFLFVKKEKKVIDRWSCFGAVVSIGELFE